ncbi:MAG: nucleic acid/nucleotide deaminase domain-containing protein [Potamolinea sp.]
MTLAWNDPNKNKFATAFLNYARTVSPVTQDNSQPADTLAETIIPGNSLDCAAVSDPGAPNTVDYSTNSNITGKAVPGRNLNRIVDKTDGKHAEMKILDALVAVPPYIGISKRCCLLCDLALNIANVGRRGCHGQLFDAWKFPTYISSNPARLQAFLGPVAYGTYSQLSQPNQKEALRLIETNLKQYDH